MTITRAILGVGLCAVLGSAAIGCAGSTKTADSPTTTSGVVAVKVNLDLPKTGNVKYDKFFSDVSDLAQLVADARAALDSAPATLNAAMKVTDTTDFPTALAAISGKLKGKVTVNVDVSPAGANVTVVPAAGVTLTPDEQAMADAYKKVVTDVASIPMKLEPVVAKSIDLGKQAVMLATSAKSDFMGMAAVSTLPSVIKGMSKVGSAVDSIKTDTPVIIDRSKTMSLAIKSAV